MFSIFHISWSFLIMSIIFSFNSFIVIFYKEKQRGCSLLSANKHTHIYIKYICVYIYYLFVWDYSFECLALIISLFFIINIIFHGVSITRILKVFRFYLAAKLAFLNISTLGKIKTFQLNRYLTLMIVWEKLYHLIS